MSGDLKHPSKAIPKGTLYGLGLTFLLYAMVIVALAAAISRETFYLNTNVIQLVRYSKYTVGKVVGHPALATESHIFHSKPTTWH